MSQKRREKERRNEGKNFDFIEQNFTVCFNETENDIKKNKKKREQRDKIESQFEFIRIYLNG